ncbi:MAG: DUF4476 domain-containing protein [Bacteroidetes bacterium]|nr:MAG: DUF4476 domain-containing protein [Bacteroidota bacterium]
MRPLVKFATCVLFLASTGMTFSQNSTLIVFSSGGDKFRLEVNGNILNASPQSRVEASNLFGPAIRIKIFPEESPVPVISKNLFNTPNGRLFYIYKRDPKGKYILEKTTGDWSGEAAGETAVTMPPPKALPVKKQDPTGTPKESTTTKKEPSPATIKPTSTTSTTSITSSTSTTPTPATETKAVRCEYPLNEAEFQFSLTTVTRHPYDSPKLSAAKNLAKTACLTSAQVRDILYLFENETSRIEFSKYAYNYVYDPQNYGIARDVLDPFSMEELDAYLRSVDNK